MKKSVDRSIKINQYKKPSQEITSRQLKDFIKKDTAILMKDIIKNAYNQGYRDAFADNNLIIENIDIESCINAENYYNKTFKNIS